MLLALRFGHGTQIESDRQSCDFDGHGQVSAWLFNGFGFFDPHPFGALAGSDCWLRSCVHHCKLWGSVVGRGSHVGFAKASVMVGSKGVQAKTSVKEFGQEFQRGFHECNATALKKVAIQQRTTLLISGPFVHSRRLSLPRPRPETNGSRAIGRPARDRCLAARACAFL